MKKVLIANRGEIAVRIIRTLREIGYKSVAVYSLIDSSSLHVAMADEAVCIGDAKSNNSYLNMTNIISAALITKCDAIHPGYGFLSESPEFARKVEEAGLIFIGPKAETMELMGNKAKARATVQKYGLPVVPGSTGALSSFDELKEAAANIGYPIMLKAVSGGGGRGMRVVYRPNQLKKAYDDAKKEANASFNDDRIYIEKYIDRARHIEVQVLGDGKGKAIHLFERDCSIQRNNQKMIEEAPASVLSEENRNYITNLTADVVGKLKYRGAGTVEYLYVEEEERFYFMEMNTRVQVEHTVSEELTGVDIIKESLNIAFDGNLSYRQEDIKRHGSVIEARINAEDPSQNFLPSPGKIEKLHFGLGKDVRVDSHIYSGYVVPSYYDSMIAKIIVKSEDRNKAINRLKLALEETVIEPINTNLDFLHYILGHPNYVKNKIDIHFLTENHILD